MLPKVREALFGGRQKVQPASDGRQIPLRLHGPLLVDPRSGRPYISNFIRTTRYTPWDFLPKQILYQFSRLANFYFLCMAILQLIPGLSTTGNFTVLIPLLIFVTMTIAKEGYDDFKRYRLDRVENGRSVAVLRPVERCPARESGAELDFLRPNSSDDGFEWTTTQWQHLMVGDVIKLNRDDDIAADIVLLHADGDAAYIETMALDGETNLKRKQPPGSLTACCTPAGIARCGATFTVEDPNQNLYRFDGQVTVDGNATPLSDTEVVYRGSTLRNTSSAIGMVINTGEETKVRMNANRHPQAKRPALEAFINKVVICMAVLVTGVSALGFLAYTVWRTPSESGAWYMDSSRRVPFQEIFFGYVVMFNGVVPMSLIMGLEVIKLNQMKSIGRDLQLYHAPTDTPARCNTDTIIDDLGQIGYVFSDKTGTLTENDMKLRKINVAGTSWAHRTPLAAGEVKQDDSSDRRLRRGSDIEDPAVIEPWEPPTPSPDELSTHELLEYMRLRPASPLAQRATQFLLCLAICHTAQPEMRQRDDGGNEELQFQASSPDELALVEAARDLGFVAVERSAGSITIQMGSSSSAPERRTYDILDVLEFSSNRKRMSVVVRCPEDGEILLLCKGADTVLLPRLTVSGGGGAERGESSVLVDGPGPYSSSSSTYSGHPVAGSWELPAKFHALEDGCMCDGAETDRKCFASLDDYAREGLRTLVFCQRQLSEQEYLEWKERYHAARIELTGRDARVEAVSEEIEQSLSLVGATAIEDRLQEGVPDTIDRLRRAGIKIWMLTGDKRETAINIAHSARICGPKSAIHVLDQAAEDESLEAQCHSIVEALQQQREHTVLIVDGATLHTIQEEPASSRVQALFHAIIPAVDSVVCCRASPSQKAMLVSAIKHPRKPSPRSSFLLPRLLSRLLPTPRRPLTLSIGDGANDLAMLTTAHVGVGISGKEGQQASRVADVSVARFRYLARLLLVHGRWNYHRTTRFVLAAFWKELFHGVVQGVCQAFVGFTGTSVFDSMALVLYGSLFSSLAIVAVGSWERDLGDDTLMAVPQLYRYGLAGRGLGWRNFCGWVANAFAAGLVVVCVAWAGYGASEVVDDNGWFAFGALVFTLNVVWTNVKLLILEFHHKTWVVLAFFAGTVAALWAWMGIMSVIAKPELTPYAARNGFNLTFGRDPNWWISLVVGLVLLGAMELIVKSLRRHRLTRAFWSGVSPAKEKPDLANGTVLAGYEAWYPYLWQQIEQDPDARDRLRRLLPKPEVHPPEPPMVKAEKKTRRPADTPWRQQRLKAWRPIITPRKAIGLFFVLSVIMFPIGAVLMLATRQVEEISIDYTDCLALSPSTTATSTQIPTRYISSHFKNSDDDDPSIRPPSWSHSTQTPIDNSSSSICSIQFTLPHRLPPPVFLHYRLTNFHQNHRDYIASADAAQLRGAPRSAASLLDPCKPLAVDPESGKPYYPCGLVANSLFNDTFSAPRRVDDDRGSTYNMTTEGIAFAADVREAVVGKTRYEADEVVPPPAWRARFPNGYADGGVPDLSRDEAFVVWMRTAALPTFRKLAMRNDAEWMEAGRWQVDVEDNYEVASFGGTKSVVISKPSKLGGDNESLASLCLLISGVTLVLGVGLTITNLVKSRKLVDYALLS